MRHSLLAVVAALFVVFSSDAHGQENGEVSFQLFYDSLAPYGDWVDVDGYGYCWQPRVTTSWRPYSDGRWAYTEAGWTWVSYEDFGWATYHYGRWTKLRNRGWVWVPGYEWAPAWVSWRTNDEYIGWAPLPPEAVWNANQGFNVSVDSNYDIGPEYYNFCPISSFGSTGLAPVIVNPVNNVTIVYNTINITYISIYQRGIYCGGPNWNYINQRCRQPIPQYRLDCRRDYDWASLREHGGRAVVQNGALSLPAPRIDRDIPQGRPRNIAYQASRNDVNRGWDEIRDSRARDQIRERNQQQARVLQNQPRPAIAALPANIGQPIEQQSDFSRSRGNRKNRGDQQANNQNQQTPPSSSGAVVANPSNMPPTGTAPSTRPWSGDGSTDNLSNDRRGDRGDDRAQQGRQRQEEAMQQQTDEQRQRRQAMQQQAQQQQQNFQRQQQPQQQSLQQQQAQQRLDQQRQEMRDRVAEQQRQQQQQSQQQQNFQRQQQQMEQQRQWNQQQRQQQFQQNQQFRQQQQFQQSQQPRQSQQVQQSQQPRQSQQIQPQQQGGGMGQGRRQQRSE